MRVARGNYSMTQPVPCSVERARLLRVRVLCGRVCACAARADCCSAESAWRKPYRDSESRLAKGRPWLLLWCGGGYSARPSRVRSGAQWRKEQSRGCRVEEKSHVTMVG